MHLFELAPEVFEDLCLALVRELPGVQSAEKHGRRGQADDAVDIVARRADGRIDLFQCKRYASYSGDNLKLHVNQFVEAHTKWQSRSDIARYVLIVACSTEDATVHRKLEAAEAWFLNEGMEIELWSSGTVAHKLGDHPHLVRKFFHEYWVDKLCRFSDADAVMKYSDTFGADVSDLDHSYDWYCEIGFTNCSQLTPGVHVLYEEHAMFPDLDEKEYKRLRNIKIHNDPYKISPRGFILLSKGMHDWIDPRDRNRRIYKSRLRDVQHCKDLRHAIVDILPSEWFGPEKGELL
ncbi:MAG: hypothetical protein K2Q10_07490 [Rhodospirillales bacterium]|nr:hypothetical protein [Rhodospirillales bacterium]